MLKITRSLIKHLNTKEGNLQATSLPLLINTILRYGNKVDGNAIIESCLVNPYSHDMGLFAPIIEKWGDLSTAKQLAKCYIKNGELIDTDFTEVLELLGNLKYEPIKPLLIKHAFSEESDHYTSKNAVLGLLNFDCSDIQDILLEQIENTYGKNLFHEYIPALVCKISNRRAILEKLFELGDTTCSTDCNAGIILGFSLCPEGVTYFKKAIFNPDWEACSSATGTIHATYQGIKNLNISFSELFADIQKLEGKSQKEGLENLFDLLKIKIDDLFPHAESFMELHKDFFSFDGKSSLYSISDKTGLINTFYETQKLIELKASEELILRCQKEE
ncbi:hypothetical protein R9C00_23595 [Flammeovirgaceae bacterium SG7u.111]|nr:hypothetical protein [Flammeovirgaceae bacterium SG7u.132]WPO34690.1 hypothetical protein R9C00_23595 [Flammeovirgaceae bacterium SG7u.111]